MSNQLRRCCDCNFPIGNRDKFCPRCGERQPRELGLPAVSVAFSMHSAAHVAQDAGEQSRTRVGLLRFARIASACTLIMWLTLSLSKILNKIKYLQFIAICALNPGATALRGTDHVAQAR